MRVLNWKKTLICGEGRLESDAVALNILYSFKMNDIYLSSILFL